MSDNEQEFNEGHIIEGLDRLHVVTTMLHEFLADHPGIIKAGVQNDVHLAADILLAAYQKVGELDEHVCEECGTVNDTHHSAQCIDRTKAAEMKPRFIAWDGGECPVNQNLKVEYLMRDAGTGAATAGKLCWENYQTTSDIIAYRVIEENIIVVDDFQFQKVLNAIDNPPKPTPAVLDLMNPYPFEEQ